MPGTFEPAPSPLVRRVATYARVSSDDQAERGTIATQIGLLEQRISVTTGIVMVGRFADDGVSGTIPLAERPDGRRLMALAAGGSIDEVWVYKVDRLGRDPIDLLALRRRLDALGVRIVSIVEGEQHGLGYDIQAVVAGYNREEFLRRSADVMDRAAHEGRYTGGIVPYGYRVAGVKPHCRLVPDDRYVRAEWTAAEAVRHMYRRVGLDHWSAGAARPIIMSARIPLTIRMKLVRAWWTTRPNWVNTRKRRRFGRACRSPASRATALSSSSRSRVITWSRSQAALAPCLALG